MAEMPPHVWANSSRANFQQDHFSRPGSNVCARPSRLSTGVFAWKIGDAVRREQPGSHPIDRDNRVGAIRSWLMRHDRLTANQPQLDKVLRALGVTQRLTRVQTPGRRFEFSWQALQDPRELCELQVEPGGQRGETKQSVGWRWLECDVLQIQVDTNAQLLADRATI